MNRNLISAFGLSLTGYVFGKTTSPANISRTRAIAGIRNVSFLVCKRTALNEQRSRKSCILLLPHPTCRLPTPSPTPAGRLVYQYFCDSCVCPLGAPSRSLPRPNHRAPPPPPPLVPPSPLLGQVNRRQAKPLPESNKQPHRPATALSARTDHLHTSTSIFIYRRLNFSYLTLPLLLTPTLFHHQHHKNRRHRSLRHLQSHPPPLGYLRSHLS